MTRPLSVAAVQAAPVPLDSPPGEFAAQLRGVVAEAPVDLVVYPELHLFGTGAAGPDRAAELLRAAAVPLHGPLTDRLGALARELGIWLVPGSICERGPAGELFNTALAFSPTGELVAHYRKVFPWRPFEPFTPGGEFTVFDLPGLGRLGLSICYDAWFPEVTRHLAWLGAEAVLNVVKTTTPDRAQELVLARANSIVEQTFTVSVNCAAPEGRGRSIVVDPEGGVLREAGPDPVVLRAVLDLDHVARVRKHGTAGTNRMWAQFLPGDRPLELPLYAGRVDPARWTPATPPATRASANPPLTDQEHVL